jgi:hypothetical protein
VRIGLATVGLTPDFPVQVTLLRAIAGNRRGVWSVQ